MNQYNKINQKYSISNAVYQSLIALDNISTLEEIKEYIYKHDLYEFGAAEKNIDDVIRIQIERKCINSSFKETSKEKLFFKESSKTYGLVEWLDSIDNLEIKIKTNENLNDVDNNLDSLSEEGDKKLRYTTTYERDSSLRNRAILIHGHTCKVCDFNFEKFYGEYAKDFIHIHHIKPLFEGKQTVNPKTDLVPVCANCHAIIHRRRDKTLTIEELKSMIL